MSDLMKHINQVDCFVFVLLIVLICVSCIIAYSLYFSAGTEEAEPQCRRDPVVLPRLPNPIGPEGPQAARIRIHPVFQPATDSTIDRQTDEQSALLLRSKRRFGRFGLAVGGGRQERRRRDEALRDRDVVRLLSDGIRRCDDALSVPRFC